MEKCLDPIKIFYTNKFFPCKRHFFKANNISIKTFKNTDEKGM